jgi:uncharacterized membrane protein YfcA
MTPEQLLVAGAAVAVGSFVQGSVGFGLGLLGAPVLALVDPRLVPGPLLVAATLLACVLLWRERHDVDLAGLRWALVGRVPGTVAGAAALSLLPGRRLSLGFALLVLLAVVLSLLDLHVAPTPHTLFTAGAVSGFMGTASGIGGPPMALVYQRAPGARLRATMAGYFVVGSVLSVAGLAAFGRFGAEEARLSTVLLPFVLVGLGISGLAGRRLDRGHTRTAVLAASALAAFALVLDAFA